MKYLGCLTVRRLIIFTVKRLSEDPYLKSLLVEYEPKHRERFCSFTRYAIRLRVEPYFLAALHRAVSTKAVNSAINGTATVAKQIQYLQAHVIIKQNEAFKASSTCNNTAKYRNKALKWPCDNQQQ